MLTTEFVSVMQGRAVIYLFTGAKKLLTVILQLNRFNFDGLHGKLPRDTQFLVVHGKVDETVPYYCGEEILRRIPWAKMVEVGPSPGQVPDLDFGHHWFEYFDVQVWDDVVERFLGHAQAGNPLCGYTARL